MTRDKENRRYDTENKRHRRQETLTQRTKDREDKRHEIEDKKQRRQETRD